MDTFLTEKQTEAYLASETRTINLVGGKSEVITATALFWHTVDLLIEARIVTMDQLIRYTHLNMNGEHRYSFSEAFQSVVAHIDQRMK